MILKDNDKRLENQFKSDLLKLQNIWRLNKVVGDSSTAGQAMAGPEFATFHSN